MSTYPDEHERRKETINWSKGSLILKIVKVSISEYVSAQWEAFLLTWTTEELEDLPHFFDVVDADKIKYKNKKWKIETSCEICKKIFKNILQTQQNQWSRHLVWKPVEKQTKYSGSKIVETNDYQKCCEICRENQCPFAAEQEGFDLQKTKPSDFGLVALFQGHTPKALNNIQEFYWRIGKMFMYFGRETNMIRNTSPADTDPSLVFKMMKNCKLFEPLVEEMSIYDEVLDARNHLMHSPNQRIPNDDLMTLIGDFTRFLTEFKGNSSRCQRGIEEIQKLKAVDVLIIEEVKIIKRAFEIQREAVNYDLNVKGRYGVSEYVLQGVLTMNELKSKTENWTYDADLQRREDELKRRDYEATLKAEKSALESENRLLRSEIETLEQRVRDLKEKIKDLKAKKTDGLVVGGIQNAVGGLEAGAIAGAEALDDFGEIGRVVGGLFGGIAGGIAGFRR